MITNDSWITEKAKAGLISPFEERLIRKVEHNMTKIPVISYGLGSYSYDIRLSPDDFRIFRRIPGEIVDPKNFNPSNLEPAKLHKSDLGNYFILSANSYGLGCWFYFSKGKIAKSHIKTEQGSIKIKRGLL